jgi:hypothetical protein
LTVKKLLPDKFVVEFIVATRGGKESVAVRDEQVKNDCGLKEKKYIKIYHLVLKNIYVAS